EEPPHRPYAERDLRGRQALEPVGLFLDVDRLDAPLAIRPGVEPERSHARPPWRRRRRADASPGGTRRGDRTKVYYLGRNFWYAWGDQTQTGGARGREASLRGDEISVRLLLIAIMTLGPVASAVAITSEEFQLRSGAAIVALCAPPASGR